VRWPAILGVSVAVHGAVFAALPDERARAVALPPPTPLVMLEPLPEPVSLTTFEVVVLPEQAATAAGAATTAAAVPATAKRASIRTATAAATGTPTATEPAPGPSRFGSMRFPDAEPRVTAPQELDWSLPVDMIAAIIGKPSPEIPPPTGELVENRDGTHTKYDSVFVATINEDGTVKFEDRPNLRVHFALPTPKGIKQRLAQWSEDPFGTSSGQLKKMPEGSIEDDDGDGKMDEGGVIPIIAGGFDVTDAVMRMVGQDPYDAKKRAFLERTFDERVEIGRKHRSDQLEDAERFILAHAEQLWDRADFTIAEKRELVFELWDDCAETGDDELVDAGQRARAALLRFISVRMPAGSDDGFSASEIKALDRRRHSKAHFAPY